MRRKRDGWSQMVARWTASGMSATEFSRHIGVSVATLTRWRRDVGTRLEGHPALAKIVEVRPAAVRTDDRFEVRLGDGRCIGVPVSFDASALERLLRVLEASR